MAKYNVLGRIEAVWNKHGGEEGIDLFLAGRTVVSTTGPNILIIDRSIAPTYPDWKKEVMHPEFENTGPTHLDLRTVIPYLHPEQKNGGHIGGQKLWDFLKQSGLIEYCLDLHVGEELVKHPDLWPTAWKGKTVFLWKSVVLDAYGDLSVPYVVGGAGGVVVYWRWLGSDWYGDSPAALSAS